MPIDPVCRMEVNENVDYKSEYNERKYFFCSADCKEEFDEVPEDHVGGDDE